jgi:hypothetical protein
MKVVALLDRPGEQSFGMVPFVVLGKDHKLRVIGLIGARTDTITTPELCQLIEAGHAWSVHSSGARIATTHGNALAAGWIGRMFEQQIGAIGAPPHTAPTQRYVLEGVGSFWIDDSAEIYRCLSNWVDACAARVFREKSAAIAEMMDWTLPDMPVTQAAVWWTKKTTEEKQAYATFISRTVRRGTDPTALAAEYDHIARCHL